MQLGRTPPRKCYACGGIGHIVRVCPTRAAQNPQNPLPPFGSPAVLPPQSLHKKRACRNARRSAHALAPQPLVPVAHSTKAPQVPSIIDLRVAAPPSLVRVDTKPPLHARAVPPIVLELASDQQHLAPLRKKARVAVRIVDGNA